MDKLILGLAVILLLGIGLALIPGCQTMPGASLMRKLPPKEALGDVVYKTNWMLTLAGIGFAASIFAMMLGSSKWGLAGLVASCASTAYTLATIRYACIIAIGGLLVGVLSFITMLVKNKKTIFSFVDGVQEAKELVRYHTRSESCPQYVNIGMGKKLTPEAEKMVKKRKAQLDDPHTKS